MATEAGPSSSGTAEERLVVDFLSAFVGGDADAVADLVTADCVLHRPRRPLDVEGRDAIAESTRTNEGTFADLAIRLEESVADGNRIAAFVVASGRNVGPIRMDEREIAPSGRSFEVPQIGLYRVRNGKIAEAWILADALGIVQQLDNFPAGPRAMARILFRQVRWRLGGRKPVD